MQTSGILFVERITLLLAEQGKTQAQLKRDLNLSRNRIDNWRERDCLPSADLACQIAEYLGTTVDYLVYGITPTHSFNTKKIIDDFLSLSPENQTAVSLMISSLLATQNAAEKKVSN